MDDTGADPRKLKLELTESMLLDNVEDIIAKMIDLQGAGVSAFPSTTSAPAIRRLSYLKRLPLRPIEDRPILRPRRADRSQRRADRPHHHRPRPKAWA